MAPMVVLAFVLILFTPAPLQPVQGQEVGTLAEHLRKAYGEDWPHYAPWVHSEIKVADDVKAYNLRAVDLGYDLVPGVPARGVLVAYASSNKVGLAFVNRTGEFFKLCEVPIGDPPKHREGLDLDYMEAEGDSTKKTVLIAWGTDNRLYALKVKLGVLKLGSDENAKANFPVVTEILNPIEIDLPPGYTDVRQVRVLALDDKFIVFFTAQREDKPIEEYGYDLFYVLIGPDETPKLGPRDLGFQDIMVFQVKPLNGPSLIGLAFMARWRQIGAGVWWVTMRLEGDSLKAIQMRKISDDWFEIPQVERAVLDFDFYRLDSGDYSVLVVWNDSRPPHELIDRLCTYEVFKGYTFVWQEDKLWVAYGQLFTVSESGYLKSFYNIEDKDGDGHFTFSESDKPGNFPVAYLMKIDVGNQKCNLEFGEIDSITVYVAPGVNRKGGKKQYFVVDASIHTIDKAISQHLSWARIGKLEQDNTYGFDVFSVPVPANPTGEGIVGTEVDTCDKSKYVAYPVFNEDGSKVIPKPNENWIEPNLRCMIFFYDTLQFSRAYATKQTLMTSADQIDIKSARFSGKGGEENVVFEGFVDEISDKHVLFVIPTIPVVDLVENIYKKYDFYVYLALVHYDNNGVSADIVAVGVGSTGLRTTPVNLYIQVNVDNMPANGGVTIYLNSKKITNVQIKDGRATTEITVNTDINTCNLRFEFGIKDPRQVIFSIDTTLRRGYLLDDVVRFYSLYPFTVLKFRPIRTEDHPGTQVGPVVYDLRSQQPALPTAYLEVSYTTDFSDRVPPGPALVEILGPAPPEEPTPGTPTSGYAMVSGSEIVRSENLAVERIVSQDLKETQVHVRFLPPAVEALKCITRVVMSGTNIDRKAIQKAAAEALEKLREYLNDGLLKSPISNRVKQTLEELADIDRIKSMKDEELVMKLNAVINNLKRLVEGTYHVFILYHPMGSVQKYPKSIENREDLKHLINELTYTGVTSWIPIDVACEVPNVIPPETRTETGGTVSTTEVPVVPPPTELPSPKPESQNQGHEGTESVGRWKSRQAGTSSPTPLLPVLPYRRGLSRPKLRRRSCTRRAR